MKISIICFSLTGEATGEKLKSKLSALGHEILLYKKSKYLKDSIREPLKEWTKEQFDRSDAIIFISATGIAVRSIAPYIVSKKTDPAVLVLDECGTYIISLLSGHLGSANDLTKEAAKAIGGIPVITTATDLHDQFAVDEFAKKNHCSIFNMKAAKDVSAAVLAKDTVGFYSEFPCDEELPKGLTRCDRNGEAVNEPGFFPRIGVAVTIHTNCKPFINTVQVVPAVVTLGMGCRRGKEEEKIENAAKRCLETQQIYKEAVEKLTSIDLKKEEKGLLTLSKKWNLPFITYTSDELKKVQGNFTASSFVKQITGVDNICERSCILGSDNGKIIQNKIGEDGITTAMALRKWRSYFE